MSPEAERLLIQFFDLVGEDEDEAAEERLDVFWHAASAEDRTLMAGLLADMKMLRDQEVTLDEFQHMAPLDLQERALTAVKTERWIDALAALRGPRSTNLTPAVVARLRWHALDALGFSMAADRFREHADMLSPGSFASIDAFLGVLPTSCQPTARNSARPMRYATDTGSGPCTGTTT